jgi:flagella basal body P-ring formation protein FlgA
MNKLYYYQALVVLFLTTSCIYSSLTAASENNLTSASLVSQAEQFILNELDPQGDKDIEITAMPIDERVHIPACESEITFSASQESLSQSNISVKAECQNSNWYVFMLVKAIEIQPVVVMSSAVSPGTLLTDNNVHVIYMDKKRLRSSTFADIDQVIGARIKRRVSSGRPVESKNLCFVCKGDRVVISAITETMQVKTSGIALEDGNMGETILVENRRSSKKVYAKVASTGRVEIAI